MFSDAKDTGKVVHVEEGRMLQTVGNLYEVLYEHMGNPTSGSLVRV